MILKYRAQQHLTKEKNDANNNINNNTVCFIIINDIIYLAKFGNHIII